MPVSTCRSCGAAIVWAKTTTGKSMPLDAEPVPDGNIVLHEGVAYVTGTGDRKSHFATCPNAARHRRGR